MSDFCGIVFKSLDSLLEYLNKEQFKHLEVIETLLKIYNEVKAANNSSIVNKKYPFIVLEGLDGCGKSSAAERLSERIGAKLCRMPPTCIKHIRDIFDTPDYTDVRPAYYALASYIAAIEITTFLQDQPVVLDRYWHSTVSFSITHAVLNMPDRFSLPAENDEIYVWPEDLLKPDLICYMYVNEKARLKRLRSRTNYTDPDELLEMEKQFRNSAVTAFNRITLKFTPIYAQLSKQRVLESLLEYVNPLLALESGQST